MTTVTDSISRFFIWWFGELVACVPQGLRRVLWREPTVLAIAAGDGDAKVSLRKRDGMRELGRLAFDRGREPRLQLAELLRGVSLRDVETAILVPAATILRRNVNLPLAAAENLRGVLAFEMDRHTPFKANEVAFDYRIVGTDPDAKRINIDLAVVPNDAVERARLVAATLDLTPDRIGVAGNADEASFNFLPAQRTGRSATRQRLAIAFAILAVILAIVAVYMPLLAKQRTLAAYETRLTESRSAALETEALKKRLAAELEHDRFLIDRRAMIPSATVMLADVTDRLPDGTWLVQLHWQGDKLVMAGYSPSATPLIAELEDSDILSEVRFGSPVTPDPRVERERFNITAAVAAPGR
jgi:general secretion pathway protein L